MALIRSSPDNSRLKNLGRNRHKVERYGAQLGRTGQVFPKCDRRRPKFHHVRAGVGQIRWFAQIWSIRAKLGPARTKIVPRFAEFHTRFGPSVEKLWPISASSTELGPTLGNLGPNPTNSGASLSRRERQKQVSPEKATGTEQVQLRWPNRCRRKIMGAVTAASHAAGRLPRPAPAALRIELLQILVATSFQGTLRVLPPTRAPTRHHFQGFRAAE